MEQVHGVLVIIEMLYFLMLTIVHHLIQIIAKNDFLLLSERSSDVDECRRCREMFSINFAKAKPLLGKFV